MHKITKEGYFLPVIQALNGLEIFDTGANTPMAIRGVCSTCHVKGDYVVKFKGAQRMSVEASCRELIASFIAMELDILVPEPVIVDVSPEFVESLKGSLVYEMALKSIGYNFGCAMFRGFRPLTRDQHLTASLMGQAENIFAYDLFVSNADRNFIKNNMLTDGSNIIIFDHEAAFGFVMDLVKNPEPWLIPQALRFWINKHFFYRRLRKHRPGFDLFFDKLSSLNQNFWDKLSVLLPEEWNTAQVEQIILTLKAIVNKKEIFQKEIKRILS